MKHYTFASIKELLKAQELNQINAEELLAFFLARFARYDEELHSALEIFDTKSILHEKHRGLLAGIPGIIKDNICQKNRITSCASKMLEHFVSPYDATVCKRLKEEGALLIGRANCDEFAMGSSTETSAFQQTKNPWDKTRVPGGSSGGSAAAVAAGLVPWALGTDTGGSVRQPAAFCGIIGLKPTYGLVSRYGMIAYGSSLDQVGVLTRTVYDNAVVLSAIAGKDSHDSTSLAVEKKDYTKNLTGTMPHGLRIGIIEDALYAQGMDPDVVKAIEDAISVLEQGGCTIKKVNMPALDYSTSAYFIISRAEAASNLARFDGVRYGLRNKNAQTLQEMYTKTRHDGFGQEVKVRIMVGNYVLSVGHAAEFYENANKVRTLIRHEFAQQFKEVDILLMPTHPAPAFKIGAFEKNKLQMDLQDYFTCPMNLAGVPALSILCGFSRDQLPIGLQLIGSHLTEDLLYQVAHAYEQKTEWHTMHPKGFE